MRQIPTVTHQGHPGDAAKLPAPWTVDDDRFDVHTLPNQPALAENCSPDFVDVHFRTYRKVGEWERGSLVGVGWVPA